jgi:hypothetical protein
MQKTSCSIAREKLGYPNKRRGKNILAQKLILMDVEKSRILKSDAFSISKFVSSSSQIIAMSNQGMLTEGEGSVQLTSLLRKLVL